MSDNTKTGQNKWLILDRTPLATSGCSERNGSHSENAEHSGIAEHESEFVMHVGTCAIYTSIYTIVVFTS